MYLIVDKNYWISCEYWECCFKQNNMILTKGDLPEKMQIE